MQGLEGDFFVFVKIVEELADANYQIGLIKLIANIPP